LISLLERPEGASVAEIGQRLGWLPHTVRAAITGLRKAGGEVTRSKDADDPSVYRLAPVKSAGERGRALPGHQKGVTKEALPRLLELDLRRLRELWCRLYKTATAPRLSRELLMRAVAYRIQELASGGLRPELQRQLHQIALELQQTGRVTMRPRPQLK